MDKETLAANFTHIKGWGVDIDPRNEPTYPMKHYTGDDHRRLNYERPVLQPPSVEILHSNERPGLTAVYGTTLPPKGLSGRVRRYAFKYSEGSFGHWIPLILADRLDAAEGLIDDLRRGYIPNIFAECGLKAAWKHNPKAIVRKVVVAATVVTVLAFLLKGRKKRLS